MMNLKSIVVLTLSAVAVTAPMAKANTTGVCIPFGGMPEQSCSMTETGNRVLIGGFQGAPVLTKQNDWQAVDHRGDSYKILKGGDGSVTYLQPSTGAKFTF